MQAISMDRDIYPDPDNFDGFRFFRLRSSNSPDEARMVYAASNFDSMVFGYGRHACPGQFFADCGIKMIMACLLSKYGFKFSDGLIGRPESFPAETQSLPIHSVKVLCRGRYHK